MSRLPSITRTCFAALIAVFACASTLNAETSTLRIQFKLKGKASELPPLEPNVDKAFCGKKPIPDETLIVNSENNGLKNVIVYVYTGRRGTKLPNGGQGLFAQIAGWMEPLPHDAEESLVFEDKVRGGRLSRAHIAAVQRGVAESLGHGPIDGYEVIGVRFVLTDGLEHEKDSSELAFQLCAIEAMQREVFPRCRAELLEPVMDLEISFPQPFQGAVSGHLCQRRAVVRETRFENQNCVLNATAPLAELFDYANDLRSITKGQGEFSMHPSHYDRVPKSYSGLSN